MATVRSRLARNRIQKIWSAFGRFRYEVFKMLKSEGKINDLVIENMMNWRHSGFNVYCGNAIWPHNEDGLENLARYIIRASFSQERMTYIPANDTSNGVSKVIYQGKDGTSTKTFDALDWLAQLVTHIPNKGESADQILWIL